MWRIVQLLFWWVFLFKQGHVCGTQFSSFDFSQTFLFSFFEENKGRIVCGIIAWNGNSRGGGAGVCHARMQVSRCWNESSIISQIRPLIKKSRKNNILKGNKVKVRSWYEGCWSRRNVSCTQACDCPQTGEVKRKLICVATCWTGITRRLIHKVKPLPKIPLSNQAHLERRCGLVLLQLIPLSTFGFREMDQESEHVHLTQQ